MNSLHLKKPLLFFQRKTSQKINLLVWIITSLIINACDLGKYFDDIKQETEQALIILQDISNKLAQQSNQWQSIVTQDLVQKLPENIGKELQATVNHANLAVSADIKCSADFMGDRIKENVDNLIRDLKKEPRKPLEPKICQAVPDAFVMGKEIKVSFDGYNFNSGDLRVVFRSEDSETKVTSFARSSDYRITVDTSQNGRLYQKMCDKPDRRTIALVNGTEILSEVLVQRKTCPPPPPLPQRLPSNVYAQYHEFRPGTITWKPDYTILVGGTCTPGYQLEECAAAQGNQGGAHCMSWPVSPNVLESCACYVRAWADGHNVGVDCYIKIFEIGLPPKPVAPPPCTECPD